MLEFIKFDSRNEEHIKLAQNSCDIIFEDDDGFLKFGYLYEKYLNNGHSIYQMRSSDSVKVNADNMYFCIISKY